MYKSITLRTIEASRTQNPKRIAEIIRDCENKEIPVGMIDVAVDIWETVTANLPPCGRNSLKRKLTIILQLAVLFERLEEENHG